LPCLTLLQNGIGKISELDLLSWDSWQIEDFLVHL
jgi:hypothetical protein